MDTPPPPALTSEDRLWGALAHFSALTGYITGLGWIAGPLIIWLWKRDTSPFAGEQAREALNFAISIVIYIAISLLLCITIFWILIVPFALSLIGAFHVICVIVAGLKAYEGRPFRYPLNLRLIK